jgi:hypothetical protein
LELQARIARELIPFLPDPDDDWSAELDATMTWTPDWSAEADRPRAAAAGGASATIDYMLDDELLQFTAVCSAQKLELRWTPPEAHDFRHLILIFRDPQTNIEKGSGHDAGRLNAGIWQATSETLGFSPLDAWSLELLLVTPTE